MAYFANGSESDYYTEEYCDRCVHGKYKMCPVLSLHFEWNYEAVGKGADETKRYALETLWPRAAGGQNGECAMFVAAEGEVDDD